MNTWYIIIGMHRFTVQGVKAGQKAIHPTKPVVKTGSQYDAGTVSIMERREHHGRKRFSLVKFFDILIGWTLANAGDIMLELNLSQLQHHPDARNAMLVPASYCEPSLRFTPTKSSQVPALGMAKQTLLKKDTTWHAQKLCTATYIEPVWLLTKALLDRV